MGASFTPGPWLVWPEIDGGIGRDRHLVYISVGPEDGRRVGATSVYGTRQGAPTNSRSKRNIPEDECRANARLIAAAPALYEALQSAEALWAQREDELGCLSDELTKVRECARAALALTQGNPL